MRVVGFFLFFFFLSELSLAQLDSLYKWREREIVTNKDSLSVAKKDFFHQIGATLLLDWGTGNPSGRYNYIFANGNRRDSIPEANDYITLGALTYEPRCNLFNYSDFFSISFNLPTTAQFCIYTKHEGVFGFRTVPMIDLNLFNHSTFNNLSRFGITVGGGYALNLSPLFFFEYSRLTNDKKFWASPVVRAGLKFPFRGRNCFLNFMYGFPSEKETKGQYKYSKGLMCVFTAGIILNYD